MNKLKMLHEAVDVTECSLRQVSSFTNNHDLSLLYQREKQLRNLRKNYTSIVKILGGDWLFKFDQLNTKSYLLEFGLNSEGVQQSPMVIEA
jgi:hypothetical protein